MDKTLPENVVPLFTKKRRRPRARKPCATSVKDSAFTRADTHGEFGPVTGQFVIVSRRGQRIVMEIGASIDLAVKHPQLCVHLADNFAFDIAMLLLARIDPAHVELGCDERAQATIATLRKVAQLYENTAPRSGLR